MHPGQVADVFLEACRRDERAVAGVMLRELARALRDKRPLRTRRMAKSDRQLALIVDSLWEDVSGGAELTQVALLFRTLLTWFAYREQALEEARGSRGKVGGDVLGPGEA